MLLADGSCWQLLRVVGLHALSPSCFRPFCRRLYLPPTFFIYLQVRLALRAAFGNSERAADFLMSGAIPPAALAAADAAARGGRAGGGAAPAGGAAPGGAGDSPLAQMRAHPQINEMRRLVRGNPGAVQGLLAQIGAQNPALLATIVANQDEFIAILNEPTTDGDDGEDDDGEGGEAMGEDDDDEEGGMAGMRELALAERHMGRRTESQLSADEGRLKAAV